MVVNEYIVEEIVNGLVRLVSKEREMGMNWECCEQLHVFPLDRSRFVDNLEIFFKVPRDVRVLGVDNFLGLQPFLFITGVEKNYKTVKMTVRNRSETGGVWREGGRFIDMVGDYDIYIDGLE